MLYFSLIFYLIGLFPIYIFQMRVWVRENPDNHWLSGFFCFYGAYKSLIRQLADRMLFGWMWYVLLPCLPWFVAIVQIRLTFIRANLPPISIRLSFGELPMGRSYVPASPCLWWSRELCCCQWRVILPSFKLKESVVSFGLSWSGRCFTTCSLG